MVQFWDVSTSKDDDNTVEVWAFSNYGDEPAHLLRDEAVRFANAILEAAGARTPFEFSFPAPESAAGQAIAERNDEERFARLLDRSSFGTPEAKRLMASVPQEIVDETLRRSRELRHQADSE